MSMDCKTCKGTGHIEFERGAVVKNCPHCKGTGSAKFIALCDALITPIIKERNEARAERDALRAQVEVMRGALERAREVVAFHHVTAGDRFREVELAAIDAALQVEP